MARPADGPVLAPGEAFYHFRKLGLKNSFHPLAVLLSVRIVGTVAGGVGRKTKSKVRFLDASYVKANQDGSNPAVGQQNQTIGCPEIRAANSSHSACRPS